MCPKISVSWKRKVVVPEKDDITEVYQLSWIIMARSTNVYTVYAVYLSRNHTAQMPPFLYLWLFPSVVYMLSTDSVKAHGNVIANGVCH